VTLAVEVLLCEEPLRHYTRRVMEDAGYHVLAARDGIEALTILQQSQYPVQLVITDVSMPRMTGPELAARIAIEPYPPPVLFVSGGYGSAALPGPCLRKPFRPDDLSTLAEWMVRMGASPAESPESPSGKVPLVPALRYAS
jgi:CheY-like chemotaxis protein